MDKKFEEFWIGVDNLMNCDESVKKISVSEYVETLLSVVSNVNITEKCKGRVFVYGGNNGYSIYDFRNISFGDVGHIEYEKIDLEDCSFSEYKCSIPISDMKFKTFIEISGKELDELMSMIDIIRGNVSEAKALIEKYVDNIPKMDKIEFDLVYYNSEYVNLLKYDKDMTIEEVISKVLSDREENYDKFKAFGEELKGCYVLEETSDKGYDVLKFKGAKDKFSFNTDCISYADNRGLTISNDIPFHVNKDWSEKMYKIGTSKELDKSLDSFLLSLLDCRNYLCVYTSKR